VPKLRTKVFPDTVIKNYDLHKNQSLITCSLGKLSATETILSHCDCSAPDYLPSHNI